MTNKRLQFRKVDGLFNSREAAIQYISGITVNEGVFGTGLYGEPIVAKYTDNGNNALILAIGINSGQTYHIIDTYGLQLEIDEINDKLELIGDVSASGLTDLLGRIAEEEARAQAAEAALSGAISTTKNDLVDLESQIPLTYATKEELEGGLSSVNSAITSHINEYNLNKIVDVKYDNNSGYVKLLKPNGTYTDGFDLKSMLDMSMLMDVEYNPSTQIITMVFGDSHSSRIEIPLSGLVDTYKIDSASTPYLRIVNNEFHAIVDNESQNANTLATKYYVNSYVNSAVTIGVNESKAYADQQISIASGAIIHTAEDMDAVLENRISQNESDIATLNSNSVYVRGSVNQIIDESIIFEGAPITTVSPGDIEHSLIKAVETVGGHRYYYVSNLSSDIAYSGGTSVYDVISNLSNRVAYLESVIGSYSDDFEALDNRIKNVLRGYLSGTPKEIQVVPNGDVLQVGFAGDAIFGPNPLDD